MTSSRRFSFSDSTYRVVTNVVDVNPIAFGPSGMGTESCPKAKWAEYKIRLAAARNVLVACPAIAPPEEHFNSIQPSCFVAQQRSRKFRPELRREQAYKPISR
jgi:hypothetical protein